MNSKSKIRCGRRLKHSSKITFLLISCLPKKKPVFLFPKMISDGEVVRDGGSQSLLECGIYDMLAARQVNFVSHNDASISADERRIHDQEAFSCDTYLLSANAITMDGEIFNVDGNGNRVAAMLYGPKQVIVIAGCNKITKDLNGALQRLETIAHRPTAAGCRFLPLVLHQITACTAKAYSASAVIMYVSAFNGRNASVSSLLKKNSVFVQGIKQKQL